MTLFLLHRILQRCTELRSRGEARRQLRAMSEHELRDLGIGRCEIGWLTAPSGAAAAPNARRSDAPCAPDRPRAAHA